MLLYTAKSAKAVEHTDCITAEGKGLPLNKCPKYDIKLSIANV